MKNKTLTYIPGMWTFDFGNRTGSLLQDLLRSMTQDESAKRTEYNGFQTASLQDLFLFWSKMHKLSKSEEEGVRESVESARQFIKGAMRNNHLTTQTRVYYNPLTQKDAIIHDYTTQRATKKEIDFVGPDGEIQKVLSSKQCLALTGKSPKDVKAIINYLTEISGYTWRVNQKPENIDERVVGLNECSDSLYLYCCRGPKYERASFGVRWTEKTF
ncbi:MAG: hypothetical protein AABX11_01205 [Nanoarchaeota archaeon]